MEHLRISFFHLHILHCRINLASLFSYSCPILWDLGPYEHMKNDSHTLIAIHILHNKRILFSHQIKQENGYTYTPTECFQ